MRLKYRCNDYFGTYINDAHAKMNMCITKLNKTVFCNSKYDVVHLFS